MYLGAIESNWLIVEYKHKCTLIISQILTILVFFVICSKLRLGFPVINSLILNSYNERDQLHLNRTMGLSNIYPANREYLSFHREHIMVE